MNKKNNLKKGFSILELTVTIIIVLIITSWANYEKADETQKNIIVNNLIESEKILHIITKVDNDGNVIGLLRTDTDCLSGSFNDALGTRVNMEVFATCMTGMIGNLENQISGTASSSYYKFLTNAGKLYLSGDATQDDVFNLKFDYSEVFPGTSNTRTRLRKLAVNQTIGFYNTKYPTIVTGSQIDSSNPEIGIVTIEFKY